MSRVDTKEFIEKYFPGVSTDVKWSRFYPHSFSTCKNCMFMFFCKYVARIEVPPSPMAMIGTRIHKMFYLYFKNVDIGLITRYHDKTRDINALSNKIRAHFPKTVDPGEEDAIEGFSRMEARRFDAIFESRHSDVHSIEHLYRPAFAEITVKTKKFGGRIDAIFRNDDTYMPIDWKSGFSCEIDDTIETQMNFYGILIHDVKFYDKLNGTRQQVTATRYEVHFPRSETVVSKNFSLSLQEKIRAERDGFEREVNNGHFPMRASDEYCRYTSKHPCDYFNPVCKKIMENELGMEFH